MGTCVPLRPPASSTASNSRSPQQSRSGVAYVKPENSNSCEIAVNDVRINEDDEYGKWRKLWSGNLFLLFLGLAVRATARLSSTYFCDLWLRERLPIIHVWPKERLLCKVRLGCLVGNLLDKVNANICFIYFQNSALAQLPPSTLTQSISRLRCDL